MIAEILKLFGNNIFEAEKINEKYDVKKLYKNKLY